MPLSEIPVSWALSLCSFRLNTGFANYGAKFLIVADYQFMKLIAVAKIEIKSKRRHARLNIGKLGALTKRGGHTSNDFR